MLTYFDQRLKGWHVALLSVGAIVWFLAMMFVAQAALPRFPLLRCPIGFCLAGYSANSATIALQMLGDEGRDYLLNTFMPLDQVLPFLLLLAFAVNYLWWTRPGVAWSIPLEPKYRLMLLLVPLVYCIADYMENWSFGELLHSYPKIDYRLVRRMSIITSIKSQLVAASIGIAVALPAAVVATRLMSIKRR